MKIYAYVHIFMCACVHLTDSVKIPNDEEFITLYSSLFERKLLSFLKSDALFCIKYFSNFLPLAILYLGLR